MKQIGFLCIALLISCLFACKSKQVVSEVPSKLEQSERNRLGPRGAMGSTDDFYDSMDLTEEQRLAMDQLNQDFRLKRRTALEGNRDDRDKVSQIMQALRKEQNLEVEKILDANQYAKYLDYFNEYLDRRG